MPDGQPGVTVEPPPPGGPYVPPPEPAANPTQAPVPVPRPPVAPPPVAPPPVQAPPKPPVPATPPPATPPNAPAPAAQPPAAPTGPTDSLLDGDLPAAPPVKPTVEALKLPEGNVKYPQEFLTKIVSKAPSQEEAQARLDTAHDLLSTMLAGASVKNKEWIEALRQDPEVGGKNWDASVKLFRLGVVEEFGADFAKGLAFGKLDAQPDFFKGVVRRMRAKNPSPRVDGEPIPVKTEPTTLEEQAKVMYGGMKTGYSKAKPRKDPGY